MVSVNLRRNNQSKYQVEQQYQTRTSIKAYWSSHGKIYLKQLIAIKMMVDKKRKICEQIHGFSEASSSFFLAHCPLFTTSFSLTEDVSVFPHEYPEVCLGVTWVWFRREVERIWVQYLCQWQWSIRAVAHSSSYR